MTTTRGSPGPGAHLREWKLVVTRDERRSQQGDGLVVERISLCGVSSKQPLGRAGLETWKCGSINPSDDLSH